LDSGPIHFGGSVMRVTIDFETYYDREYSLKHMLPAEYVHDSRFRILCVALQVETDRQCERRVLMPDQWEQVVRRLPWEQAEVVAHNLAFDGFILLQRYGVRPRRWRCTLQHAHRDVLPWTGSVALADVAAHLGLPAKGTALQDMEGRTEVTDEFRAYALRDVELAATLAERLAGGEIEDRMVDWTVRVGLEPRLQLDVELLQRRLKEEEEADRQLLAALGVEARHLRSPEIFASLLRGRGVEPAVKPGRRGEIYAFARTDPFMEELLMHPDPTVQALARARLRLKGRQEVDRARAFVRVARAYGGLPVPLWYHRARTGRWTGALGINLQNLKRGSWVRDAIVAPPRRRLIVADLSQIEARLTAALAGEMQLLAAFERGDPYAEFATRLFGMPVTKHTHPAERQVGKVAILGLGYGCGAQTFFERMLRYTGVPGASLAMAERVVQMYRTTYPSIPRLWRRMEELLPAMLREVPMELVLPACVLRTEPMAIVLPSGRRLWYPHLRYEDGEWRCEVPNRRIDAVLHLWGGVVTENVVQALARDVLTWAHQRLLQDGIDVVLQVHDELVAVVPADAASEAAVHVAEVLRTPPPWLHGVPLDCEVAVVERYGGAK